MNVFIQSGRIVNPLMQSEIDKFDNITRFDLSEKCYQVLKDINEQVDNFCFENMPFETLEKLKNKVDKEYLKRKKQK